MKTWHSLRLLRGVWSCVSSGAVALAVCLTVGPSTVVAQVFRCSGADAAVSLGDRPCSEGAVGEALKGLPGVPVPAAKVGLNASRQVWGDNPECERQRQRIGGYGFDRQGYWYAANIRYVERYQQDCLGYSRTATRTPREVELRQEFETQACEIKQRAVREGYVRRDSMSSYDGRVYNALAADVARGC